LGRHPPGKNGDIPPPAGRQARVNTGFPVRKPTQQAREGG